MPATTNDFQKGDLVEVEANYRTNELFYADSITLLSSGSSSEKPASSAETEKTKRTVILDQGCEPKKPLSATESMFLEQKPGKVLQEKAVSQTGQ